MASLSDFAIMPVLAASDTGRAKTWYEEKLGLTPKQEDATGGLWYEFAGGTWLLVYPTPSAGTANIEELMAELRSRGVAFEEYDFGEMGKTENGLISVMGYKAAWFKDSEGNTFEITERV